LLQVDTLSVASENLAEAVPVETLSPIELLTSGGLAGQIIMIALFLMFLLHFICTLSVLWPSMQHQIDSNFMSQIRDNIRNGRSIMLK
jgi:biopolymer transport protein ExbB